MYKVYWTSLMGSVGADDFESMIAALNHTQTMRNQGFRFVTMVSEDPNQVGKLGVDSVENGKCPDGSDYTWKKRRP